MHGKGATPKINFLSSITVLGCVFLVTVLVGMFSCERKDNGGPYNDVRVHCPDTITFDLDSASSWFYTENQLTILRSGFREEHYSTTCNVEKLK